jgi:hypothetical protein
LPKEKEFAKEKKIPKEKYFANKKYRFWQELEV